MIEPIFVFFNKLKDKGYPLEHARYDNADENTVLGKRINGMM